MGAHAQADEHLSCVEGWKVIAHSYALEATAHVFYKAGLLECVHTQCEIDGKVRIMEILDQMHRCMEWRLRNSSSKCLE